MGGHKASDPAADARSLPPVRRPPACERNVAEWVVAGRVRAWLEAIVPAARSEIALGSQRGHTACHTASPRGLAASPEKAPDESADRADGPSAPERDHGETGAERDDRSVGGTCVRAYICLRHDVADSRPRYSRYCEVAHGALGEAGHGMVWRARRSPRVLILRADSTLGN